MMNRSQEAQEARQTLFRENAIRVGVGFTANERPTVVDSLSALGPHVGRWDPNGVEIDVSLQNRGGTEQRVTLRAHLAGLPMMVATAENPDITRALNEAKRELIRQLEHQKSGHEPMNNRRLRGATIRHPSASSAPDAEDLPGT